MAHCKFTPEELQTKINQYFTQCKEDPIIKYDVIKTGERAGETLEIPITRPYMLTGLCLYIGITPETFYQYLNENYSNKRITEIATRANLIIKDNQVSGATAKIYDQTLVARMQGINERSEVVQTTIDATNKTNAEIDAAIKAIEATRK